jgi:hypothetical protein
VLDTGRSLSFAKAGSDMIKKYGNDKRLQHIIKIATILIVGRVSQTRRSDRSGNDPYNICLHRSDKNVWQLQKRS